MAPATSEARLGTAPDELTLLFTDIEGSTRLLQHLGAAYAKALALHHEIIRAGLATHRGMEVDTQGDAVFAVFSSADAAIASAAAIQQALRLAAWPGDTEVHVRMGLHTGLPTRIGSGFVGLDVHRAARICSAAHGGQVVLSHATREACNTEIQVIDLGDHRLKDLESVERLYQLLIPGQTRRFPELRSMGGRRPNNLPEWWIGTVGRQADLACVSRLLSTSHLVTLTGPGGVGKTHLALAVAHDMLDTYAGGAWFVALEAVTDARFAATAIAGVLRLREEPQRSVIDTVAEYLSGRDALLVLDNLEHLPGAVADIVQLLGAARGLTILATSRACLRVSLECEYVVTPLATAPSDGGWSDAAELFVDRARRVRRGLVFDEAERDDVMAICRRLDGLPLALELAASRLRVLSPAVLLRKLEHSLDLLTVGMRNAPSRHRTLRGAIGWSYDLLDAREQRIFRALAVFRGGWSMEAASWVCRLPDLDLLEALTLLTEQSLVRTTTQYGRESRFTMLEVLREYGLEQLDTRVETAEALERHAAYFVAMAEPWSKDLVGEHQRLRLDELEAERANVRAAALWAVEQQQPQVGLRIVAPLWRFWQLRAHFSEGLLLLESLLAAADEAPLAHWRSDGLMALGGLAYWQQDYGTARRSYEGALRDYDALGDDLGQAQASHGLGYVLLLDGEVDEARRRFDFCHRTFERLGDPDGLAQAFDGLANLCTVTGELSSAERYARQGLDQASLAGDAFMLLNTRSLLGSVMRRKHAYSEAWPVLSEAIAGYLEVGNTAGVVWMLWEFAAISEAEGKYRRAVLLSSAAETITTAIGGGIPLPLLQYFPPYDRLAKKLGPDQLSQLRQQGDRLTVEDAAELALSGD